MASNLSLFKFLIKLLIWFYKTITFFISDKYNEESLSSNKFTAKSFNVCTTVHK